MQRYSETGRRADARSRRDVADLMIELSERVTMAHARAILPAELDRALRRRFGRPEHVRPIDVFGIGVAHISAGGVELPRPNLAAAFERGTPIPPERTEEFEVVFNRIVEAEVLSAGPDTIPSSLVTAMAEIDRQYVEHETMIGTSIRDRRLQGDLLELAVRASDLGGIRSAVTEALLSIGISWEEFVGGLGPGGAAQFMDDLPTRHVTNVMRSAKLRQAEQVWERNDFNDLLALSVASVYCDVVVTEKQWVHHLRQAKVDERYQTELVSDVAALARILS